MDVAQLDPITSSAAWGLSCMLWRSTVCPWVTTACESPVQVDIDSRLCTSVGSSVASGRQINASMSYPSAQATGHHSDRFSGSRISREDGPNGSTHKHADRACSTDTDSLRCAP
jgi:hypothetical protein